MAEEIEMSHAKWVAATRAEIKRLTESLETLQAEYVSKVKPVNDRIEALEKLVRDEPAPGRPKGSTRKPKEPPREGNVTGEPTPEEQEALAKSGLESVEA